MKTFYLCIIIFSLSVQLTKSQNLWQFIGPNQNENIIAINSADLIFSGDSSGLYKSTENGVNWTYLNTGTMGSSILSIHFNANNDIFVGTEITGIFRSTDNGVIWEAINNGLSNLYGYCITSTEINHIFVGTRQGVFKSTDNGNFWEQANVGVPLTYIFSISSNSSGTIFLGTIMQSDGGIFRSTNDGYEWERLTNGLPYGANYRSIAFDTNNYIYTQGQYTGIFKSTDNGENWNETTNFPITIVNQFFITDSNYIFAATLNGIFLSNNGAETWNNISGNLANEKITSVAVNSEGIVFVGTSQGVFKSDNIQTEVLKDKNKELFFSLSQNHPNPFNPSTKISWQTPVSDWQTLKVYDVLGNEVATLVNEYRAAGSYEVEFKSTVGSHQLANGVYFYQLKAGDYVETKKMILMK
jgi:photosystem II stability/assembly factor-like uncharacterized protein